MEVGIKRWYNDVRKWGRGNSAEECKETFESLQDLSSFLKKLEVELHKVVWKSCSQSFFLAVGVRLGWEGGGEIKLGSHLQQFFSVLSLYTQDFLHSNPTLALRI